MHEVGMVASLVDAALETAHGRPVSVVRIRHATTVPRDVLEQAWSMLVADGPLDGAVLEAEPFDVPLTCSCGFDGVLAHDDVIGPGQAVCPLCSEFRSIAVTPELELVEVRTGP